MEATPTTLTDEELQEIVLGIDVPLQAQTTDALKQTLCSLPLEEQLPVTKRSFSYELTKPALISFCIGLGLGLILMLPWSWMSKKYFDNSIMQLSTRVDTLMHQLKQYEDPPHPTKQEMIQPLQPSDTIKRAT